MLHWPLAHPFCFFAPNELNSLKFLVFFFESLSPPPKTFCPPPCQRVFLKKCNVRFDQFPSSFSGFRLDQGSALIGKNMQPTSDHDFDALALLLSCRTLSARHPTPHLTKECLPSSTPRLIAPICRSQPSFCTSEQLHPFFFPTQC